MNTAWREEEKKKTKANQRGEEEMLGDAIYAKTLAND